MSHISPDIAVSAIVVTFNSVNSVIPCLRALTDEIKSASGEILLFDNNSSDATVKAVRSEFPETVIHKSEKNIGFAVANNIASSMVRGKYLLFANPDMVIDRGALSELMNAHENLHRVGAVVARMRNADGSFQPTCRKIPTMKNIFYSRGSMLPSGRRNSAEAGGYTLEEFDDIREVPAASATCMLISKEFFHSLGGFDERFFLFMEDTDLCLRIGQAGKKVFFVPTAGAVHYWGKGTSISPLKRRWFHHISVWKYFLKHHPNGFSLFLLPGALFLNFIIGTLFTPVRK